MAGVQGPVGQPWQRTHEWGQEGGWGRQRMHGHGTRTRARDAAAGSWRSPCAAAGPSAACVKGPLLHGGRAGQGRASCARTHACMLPRAALRMRPHPALAHTPCCCLAAWLLLLGPGCACAWEGRPVRAWHHNEPREPRSCSSVRPTHRFIVRVQIHDGRGVWLEGPLLQRARHAGAASPTRLCVQGLGWQRARA